MKDNSNNNVTENIIAKESEKNKPTMREKTHERLVNVSSGESVVNTLARKIAVEYRVNGMTDKLGRDVITLSQVLVHSKLNNLNKGTFNKDKGTYNDLTYRDEYHQNKKEVMNIQAVQNAIDTLSTLYITTRDKDGNELVECTDKDREKACVKVIASNSGATGNDFASECQVVILDKLASLDRENVSDDCLLSVFEKVIESSKYYRKSGSLKPVEKWQYTDTNTIRESSKSIGTYINSLRSIHENEILFSAFESDDENDTDENEKTIYKKVSSIFAIPEVDMNGKLFSYVADDNAVNLYETLLEKANLTKTEVAYLNLYIGTSEKTIQISKGQKVDTKTQGMSYNEIADKCGVNVEFVEKQLVKVREKILATGLLANYDIRYERQDNDKKAYFIECYMVDKDGNETFVTNFQSIGKASKVLNIDKGNISKVLSGKIKTISGYTFKKIEK